MKQPAGTLVSKAAKKPFRWKTETSLWLKIIPEQSVPQYSNYPNFCFSRTLFSYGPKDATFLEAHFFVFIKEVILHHSYCGERIQALNSY